MSETMEKLVLAGVHVPTIEEVLALGKDDVVKVKSFYWDCPLCKKQMYGHSLIEKKVIDGMAKVGDHEYAQRSHEDFAACIKEEIETHLEGHESTEVSVVEG